MARGRRMAQGVALTTILLALHGANSAGAATLAYSPSDFTSAVTVDDGARTYSGTVHHDASRLRIRTDTNRTGGVRTVRVFYDKRRRYINSPDGRCFTSSVPDATDISLVTDDQGQVVTDFVRDGTLEIEGVTLERWVGSSGGEPIVAGLGPVPGSALPDLTVRYVETPLGSTFYKAPFIAGAPSAPLFTLPDACVDGASGEPAPDVSIRTPADGATYAYGEVVAADFTCVDNAAALKPAGAGCAGTVPDGDRIDTSAPGMHEFSVTATQRDDLTNTATTAYTVARAIPSLNGNASPAVVIGGSVRDVVTLADGYEEGGAITFRLFGPDDDTCSGAPAFTDIVAVDGSGEYESGSFTPVAPGSYRWIASYSGDGNNHGRSTPCDAVGQGVEVDAAAFEITRLDRDESAGSAALTVGFNATGGLRIDKTKRVAPVAWQEVTGPGNAMLPVVPRGKAKKRLERTGRVTVNPRVLYAPATGGQLGTRIEIKLRLG